MMKRWMALLLLALVLLVPALGAADAEGVVVQSTCNIVQSGDYYLVYCYAQIHNNSNEVICLEQGTFDLHNGEQLLANGEVTQLWPYFLNPGEDGYVFDIISFEPDENGPVVPSVTGISYNIEYMTVNQAYASQDLAVISRIEQDAAGNMTVICELNNNTAVDAYDPTIAFGLYTDGDMFLYADGVTLQNVGIPAGGTMLLRFDVDDMFVSQWSSYGVAPAEARVSAAFRADED